MRANRTLLDVDEDSRKVVMDICREEQHPFFEHLCVMVIFGTVIFERLTPDHSVHEL
jgi:hypothetical protein